MEENQTTTTMPPPPPPPPETGGGGGAGTTTVLVAKGNAGQSMRRLPESFVPGECDVICGRGRRIFMHVGNVRFRRMVEDCLEEYSSTVTKMEKTFILGDIIAQVRAGSPDGGFVKKDPKDNRWYEVGDYLAREKTSQAFRDALFDQYKSSNTAKKLRKRGEVMKLMPRRAFSSTSLLDTKRQSIAAAAAKSSGTTYSDPLLAKLRMSKSARSVLEFGEQSGSSSSGLLSKSIMASCPNLTTTASRPSGFSSSLFAKGSSRNFEWDTAGSSSNNSNNNNNAAGSSTGGESNNKNFDWGSSSNKPVVRTSGGISMMSAAGGAMRKHSLDLLGSFTTKSQPTPSQAMAMFGNNNHNHNNNNHHNTSGEVMMLPEATMSQHMQGHHNPGENDLMGLSHVLSPAAKNNSMQQGVTAATMQQQSPHHNNHQHQHHAGGGGGIQQGAATATANDIESKLRMLRESTFETGGVGSSGGGNNNSNMFGDHDPLSGLISSIREERPSELDVFDKLVDLVGGDVPEAGSGGAGGDPFEPNPLP